MDTLSQVFGFETLFLVSIVPFDAMERAMDASSVGQAPAATGPLWPW
jgi:hypothetical protein